TSDPLQPVAPTKRVDVPLVPSPSVSAQEKAETGPNDNAVQRNQPAVDAQLSVWQPIPCVGASTKLRAAFPDHESPSIANTRVGNESEARCPQPRSHEQRRHNA